VARTITREASSRRTTSARRRDRLTRRLLPILSIAAVALIIGLVVGAGHVAPEQKLAQRFATAWEHGDYGGMYDLISDDARKRTTPIAFANAYREAAATGTATGVSAGKASDPDGGVVRLPVRVATRVWGPVAGVVKLPFSGEGDAARVDWHSNLVFPGLNPGERLRRATALSTRGDILARDGSTLAGGAGRAAAFPAASGLVGELGVPGPILRRKLRPLGYPLDARVGISGLELALNEQLAGKPGGILRAGNTTLARSTPKPGHNVRTTIDPDTQKAAVAALGNRLGGAAAIRPDGEVLALAGIAASDVQPPGSTFKMITLTAALEAGITKPTTVYPVQTETHLSGVRLQNANGESCGGTLVESFAESCNSVFAPLGAKVGGKRLVATAERFGFNRPPGIPGFAESTLPSGNKVGDDLAVGSTAIGQGDVEATALQMAVVAATIGNHGLRPKLQIEVGQRAHYTRATSPRIARTVGRLMVAVVTGGTGTAAAIPGVVVAGKTGTAELGTTVDQSGNKPQNAPETDAWFAAFAPLRKPRVAVGVLFPQAGAGGDVAAPAAHDLLAAQLQTG
jgi:Penicillin binding protein transpeptidase domain/NTF2-like N-terminal transpeptidase domain